MNPYIYVGFNNYESDFRHVVVLEFPEMALTYDDYLSWWSMEPSGEGYMSELFTYDPPSGDLVYKIFYSL